MISPILFLVFNRPDTTRRVFEAIRAAKPSRLYVAADGPRQGRPEEEQRCALVRRIATEVEWPCEVRTLFQDDNLGCREGPYAGIDWFFRHEEAGIILEDDVLPVCSFFEYCDELLSHYKNDDRVGMVSGSNFVARPNDRPDGYLFSRYTHIWGWATWRRAWQNYDLAMDEWPRWRDEGGLKRMPGSNRRFESYWHDIFESVYSGKMTSCWDYQWLFACWRVGALTILPQVNQTENLGFGTQATHTTTLAPAFVVNSKPQPLNFPLRHPDTMLQDLQLDAQIDSEVFGINAWSMFRRQLQRIGALRRLARTIRPKR